MTREMPEQFSPEEEVAFLEGVQFTFDPNEDETTSSQGKFESIQRTIDEKLAVFDEKAEENNGWSQFMDAHYFLRQAKGKVEYVLRQVRGEV